jgi:hypothetical protein
MMVALLEAGECSIGVLRPVDRLDRGRIAFAILPGQEGQAEAIARLLAEPTKKDWVERRMIISPPT